MDTQPPGPPGGLPAGAPPAEVSASQGVQIGTGNTQVNIFTAPASTPGPASPLVVGEIPQEPPGYRHRADLLEQLESPPPGSRVTVVRAVTGMRGVGKTQLAAACARARLAARWRLVAWINAETRSGLLAGLAAIADGLGLAGTQDAQAAGRAVRHWLEADGRGCLIVLDNATDPELIQPYLPAAGAAHVIITSNQQSMADLGVPVGVGVFTEPEGLAFLAGRAGRDDPPGARRLGDELGWLPLALAQAAAVIAAQHLDYATYLDRLRQTPVGDLLTPVRAGQYPDGVAAAILLALASVTADDETGACAGVMDLLSVLSAAGVRRSMLRAAGSRGILRPGNPAAALPAAATDAALARLAAASLLTFSVDGGLVAAHRLVARVTRERLAAAGALAASCLRTAQFLDQQAAELWPGWHEDRGATRDLAGQLMAACGTSAAFAADQPLTLATLDLRLWVTALLGRLDGSSAEVIAIGEALIPDMERVLGPEHPLTLGSRSNLANAYREAGRAAEAVAMDERTLAARERLLGPDHPDTLTSRNNLANAYRATGRIPEAVALHERTLAARERLQGPDHPDTLTSRNNLAVLYLAAGRVADAARLHERTLADRERILGPDHPGTLTSRNDLANAYEAAGRTAEAAGLHERTLADRERILGPDHVDTRISRRNLARARDAAAQPESSG